MTALILQLSDTSISSIRPHLEYASPLWDPNTHYLIEMLETMKQWNIDYHVSLSTIDLPQLSVLRKVAKLSLFY